MSYETVLVDRDVALRNPGLKKIHSARPIDDFGGRESRHGSVEQIFGFALLDRANGDRYLRCRSVKRLC